MSQHEEAGRQGLFRAVAVAVVVVVADQITKSWAVGRLTEGACTPETCIDVFWTLRFHLHFNPGASFSTGSGLGPLFGVLALVMTVVLLRMASRTEHRSLQVLLGVVCGGAVGNLLDRVFRAEDGPLSGEVVDFIDFQWWPIFNVADMAVVLGVAALVLSQFMFDDDATIDGDEDAAVVES